MIGSCRDSAPSQIEDRQPGEERLTSWYGMRLVSSGGCDRPPPGDFELDRNRSAVYLPRCKAFPENIELEAVLTFTCK